MIHKMLVSRHVPNVERRQLFGADGKPLTEKIFIPTQQVQRAAVVDENDKHLRAESGEHLFSDIITTKIQEEERPIVPDYVVDQEFYVFQELDAEGVNIVRYYTEDGKDFVFENDEDLRYEAKIIKRNYKEEQK